MLSSARHYYATQPFLAWCLGHYFADGRHFTWVGFPFHPYKRPNPQSSSAYFLYAGLYGPWYDRDPFDRYVRDLRVSLRRGAESLTLDADTKDRLKRCCDKVDLAFFLPVVYRVDISAISVGRLEGDVGSGASGSDEYLIRDLAESEFDVLFADECSANADVRLLADAGSTREDALLLLEARCA